MTNVGRVLILPKGAYNSETTYNMLDIVLHNGTSWLCKKTALGIEPSEEHGEHWQKLIDIGDAIDNGIEEFFGSGDSPLSLTIPGLTLYNSDNSDMRGTLCIDEQGALKFGESDILHSLNLDIRLKEYLNKYIANYLMENSYRKNKIVSYVGNGKTGYDNPCSLTFDFVPEYLLMLGYITDTGEKITFTKFENPLIFCDKLTTEFGNIYSGWDCFALTEAKKSEDGKTIYWSCREQWQNSRYQMNEKGYTYYVLAM